MESGAAYELFELLEEDHTSVVYRAREATNDRVVALKMLKREWWSDEDRRRGFLHEAVITQELEHPNIIPVYDVVNYGEGGIFYSMKRINGTRWSEAIGDRSIAENLEVLRTVCDAVAFAHSRGIIHRNLKPEEVFLGIDGEVLVQGWGLALRIRDIGTPQQSRMGGTPAYMAPEMATGPLEKIGPLSDIYLLGATLYEVVTGHPPHHGADAMKCLFAAAKNEIVETEKQGELVEIALRAMATEPEERYSSVEAFKNALRA